VTTVYHTYRTAYTTVRQPPGFGDFLRGSLALAILSFEKGFALRLDLDHHPIGPFLREKVPPDRSPEDFVEFFNERSPLLRTFVESLGPDESVGVTTNTHPDISLLTEATRNVVRSQLAFDDSVEHRPLRWRGRYPTALSRSCTYAWRTGTAASEPARCVR